MNVDAAKKLLEKYESFTIEQLEERFITLRERFLRPIYGSSVLESLTGFGSTDTCCLCLRAKELVIDKEDYCNHCIYSLNDNDYCPYCLDQTYTNITKTFNSNELYEALQKRIEYLKEIIETYEK